MSGPYGIGALTYFSAGFSPLPALGKLLMVKGVSGHHPYATKKQIEKWSVTHGPFNLALRLPSNVISLDIDQYKGDLERLSFLEENLGKLPITWNSDSRCGIGGKLLYKVPPEIKWRSNINGITVVQKTHRYVMVFPSINRESKSRYLWYEGLNGCQISENKIPAVDDLTDLPKGWVEALKKSDSIPVWSDSVGINNDDLDVFNDEQPCKYMTILEELCTEKLIRSYDGGLHDTGLTIIGSLITAASDGHSGVQEVIDRISTIFCSAARSRDLTLEWNNLLSFVLANVEPDEISKIDSCRLNIMLGKNNDQSIRNDVALLLSAGFTTRQISRILFRRR